MSFTLSRLETVEKYGKRYKGRRELLKHLNGGKLTSRQADLAKCYDCMNYYADGALDCEDKECSLYPFMPYRKGGVEKRKVAPMSPERKATFAAVRERIASNRTITQKRGIKV